VLGYQTECPISTTVEQVTVVVLLPVRVCGLFSTN